MCGRFASFTSVDAVADRLGLQLITAGARLLPPSWNVAPTNTALLVRGAELETGRWGMPAPWGRRGNIVINARAETVSSRPMFSEAFARRRCIVPVDGYYEWQKVGGGKQPWFISEIGSEPGNARNPVMCFTGIYNDDDGAAITSRSIKSAQGEMDTTLGTGSGSGVEFVLLTAAASPDVASIHNRMPVSIRVDQVEQWLEGSVADALDLLTRPEAEFAKWPVAKAVGSVANNGPALVEPVRLAGPAVAPSLF